MPDLEEPAPLAATVADLVVPGATCPTCQTTFARLSPSGLCLSCDKTDKDAKAVLRKAEERRLKGDAILGRLKDYVDEQAKLAGIAKVERRAEPEKIPEHVRKVLPSVAVTEMYKGGRRDAGWGLIGTTGTGKTMALAAIVMGQMRAELARRIPDEGPLAVDWVRWESWPILADWLRDNARSAAAEVATRIEAACTCSILVLDDLAAERRVGGYGTDYAIGKLDLIIDMRFREGLPTWYTANVDSEAGLVEAYGARLVSRLCGRNPGIRVQGPDLRLKI